MATRSRARRIFRYADADDDDEPEELDEEHQEQLIADLAKSDEAQNERYRYAFVLIPLAGAVFFFISLASEIVAAASGVIDNGRRQRLLTALLSMTSLLGSAYLLAFQPLRAPERKGKRPMYQVEAARGPVDRYLGWLVGLTAILVQVGAIVSWRRGRLEQASRETLPLVIFILTAFVRQQLAPLDLEELRKARYDLKGA